MNRIIVTGLLAGFFAVAGCEGGDGRSTAPSGPSPATDGRPAPAAAVEEQGPLEWSDRNEKVLKAAIDARARHGLDHLAYWPDLDGKTGEQRRDLLTRAALRFADALADGALDPARLHKIFELRRPETDLEAGLRQAIRKNELKDWLEALAPQDAAYDALSRAYLTESEARPAGRDIADGELVRPGAVDGRVPQIRAALAEIGYLSEASADAADQTYDGDMVRAVKTLQADFGLNPDGIVGPATLEMLNAGPEDRARTLAVAMERLRWLARDPASDRIDVNTAAAELSYVRHGEVVDRRRVVTGRPRTATPQMEAPLYRLVANPLWTLPRSIQGEVTAKGEDYMANNGFYWRGGRLVQRSGPGNSLGLVKFDMRNNHAIYLHDTPSKSLFGRQQRQLSHGCVRVHEAEAFAARVAADEGVEAEWLEAREKSRETFVPLPREIPVRLLYQTAFVTDAGTIRYTTDPYGWDDAVARKLGFSAAAASREFRSDVSDTGP
ncbi:MAG: L,D-transpeptidase family protein [Sphingomonadales bacterium]